MKRVLLFAMLGTMLLVPPARAGSRIHGTVHTRDGSVHTGVIRWDRNEAYWDHFLDAQKDDRVQVSDEGGLDLRLFGLKVVKKGGPGGWVHSQFSVPFGQLASVEPGSGSVVILTLRNGERVEVRESGDLGSDMRGLAVRDETGEETEITWGDLERVDFDSGPDGDGADRLYGVVETAIGEFTGFIVWDRDEALPEDILDGDDDRGRRQKIAFGDIQAIERDGSRGAIVTRRSGEEMRLDGTNDVDSDNRGIEITIAGLGKVALEWKHFRRLVFTAPPLSPGFEDFDGGHPLTGTVTTADGAVHAGEIRWDLDEAWTWEALDGEIDDVRFQILFGHIARIDKDSAKSARVRLTDGLELVLRDSNDVSGENKGIRVHAADGSDVEIPWEDFSSVVFTGS